MGAQLRVTYPDPNPTLTYLHLHTQSPDVTISDTLSSQLLPISAKQSKTAPYALRVAGVVSSAAIAAYLWSLAVDTWMPN